MTQRPCFDLARRGHSWFNSRVAMHPLIQGITTGHTPESLVERLGDESGITLLRTSSFDSPSARYSFVAARPFLTFRSFGSRCEVIPHVSRFTPHVQFGNPWQILDALLARCELLDEIDLPFPLGGCFGCWGYDLKNFTEPKLPRGQRPRIARLPRGFL